MRSLIEKAIEYRLSQIEHKDEQLSSNLESNSPIYSDQDFYDICFKFCDPTASATAYSQKPKVVRAEQSAMAEVENCVYGPTLDFLVEKFKRIFRLFVFKLAVR